MPVPEELREIASECGEVTSTLWARGWAERNAGNLSVDVTDRLNSPPPEGEETPFQRETVTYGELRGRVFLVTATGSRLREVARHPGRTLLLVRVTDALDGYRVLWEKHGVVAAAKTLSGAFDLVDTVNKSAEIFFLCRTAGEDPEGLSEGQIRELEDTFGERYRD